MSNLSKSLTFSSIKSMDNTSMNVSMFSYIYSEYVKYLLKTRSNVSEVESRLFDLGSSLGPKALELACAAIGPPSTIPFKRELKVENLLQWVAGPFFKWIFGNSNVSLDKVTNKTNEYYIRDNTPLTMKFVDTQTCSVSLPEYQAGILQSVIECCGFQNRVEVKSYETKEELGHHYIFLITV